MPAIYDYADKYEGKNIRVTCADGVVSSGRFVDMQTFADIDDEPESIMLSDGLYLIEVPFLDIAKTEILDDTE